MVVVRRFPKKSIHSGTIPCSGISLEALEPALGYKNAFLRACDDYNNYGFARSNQKIQIDSMVAMKLYRLKVAQQVEKHFTYGTLRLNPVCST